MTSVRSVSYALQKTNGIDQVSERLFVSVSFYIMLTGKASLYIETIISDDDPAVENTFVPTIVTAAVDAVGDGENVVDRQEPEDAEALGSTDVKRKLDRSKFGKFIMIYGETRTG